MILLDTHIWVWLVDDSNQLTSRHRKLIAEHESNGLGVCVISCWEVAKLVEKGKLELDRPVEDWVQAAVMFPVKRYLELSPAYAAAVPFGTGLYMPIILVSIWRYYRGGNLWKGRSFGRVNMQQAKIGPS